MHRMIAILKIVLNFLVVEKVKVWAAAHWGLIQLPFLRTANIMKMADMKKEKFLNIGLQYLNLLKPKYYMPFAGTYTLAGKLAELEKFKGTIELQNVLKLYQEKYKTGEGFALNSFEHFDLETGQCSKEYVPIDLEKKAQYVEDVLKHQKYDYEYDDEPTLENILRLVSKSYDRYDKKREEIQLSTKTNIYIYLPENKMFEI